MNDEEYEIDDDELGEPYAIRPNKTRIKKEIASVFAMAEEICQLSAAQIAEFELPDSIEQALRDAGKMPSNSARKRLLKYITGQLRNLDTAAVEEKLARLKNRSAHAVREHHQAERWRDVLLADNGTEQLTQFISEYPLADSQYLRQLQRNAQKEIKEAKPPKSSRLLYRYLKELISGEEIQEEDESV
ncbi:DUF615 domain-containing protein [Methylomonas paludis]|uniref:Dual-action ribosomal maturation protein DarP n=1 Tax=Methylomonas paludis TaxID=1173101 RepID=A0A975RAD9_9GAMM|nr:ribosome biogenesis factor YjgA [Methylomonas paludis]QWF71121.1 DUF615 domain-containing protein [Methylomonas paludis]